MTACNLHTAFPLIIKKQVLFHLKHPKVNATIFWASWKTRSGSKNLQEGAMHLHRLWKVRSKEKAQFAMRWLLLVQKTQLTYILKLFTFNLHFIKQTHWIARQHFLVWNSNSSSINQLFPRTLEMLFWRFVSGNCSKNHSRVLVFNWFIEKCVWIRDCYRRASVTDRASPPLECSDFEIVWKIRDVY